MEPNMRSTPAPYFNAERPIWKSAPAYAFFDRDLDGYGDTILSQYYTLQDFFAMYAECLQRHANTPLMVYSGLNVGESHIYYGESANVDGKLVTLEPQAVIVITDQEQRLETPAVSQLEWQIPKKYKGVWIDHLSYERDERLFALYPHDEAEVAIP